MTSRADELPLRYRTPDRWADETLRDVTALLSDHAHLEKKAAANALDLLHRWPASAGEQSTRWVHTLAAVARDEADHLALVTRILAKRGGKLDRQHRSTYAGELRKLVRLGRGNDELVDRLLVSALIEARSCERFVLLDAGTKRAGDDELRKLFHGLRASEMGHYLVFIDLAKLADDAGAVDERWSHMLDREAAIIARQRPGSGIHTGVSAE